MRKIIGGKIYDTTTAKVIFSTIDEDGDNTTLYKKKNGEYFLYSKTVMENLIQDHQFFDLKLWAQNNLPEKDYVKEFGEVCE